jgi:Domain of unknown function (DUF4129)
MSDEDASGGGRLFRRDALAVLLLLGFVVVVAVAAAGGTPGVGEDAPTGDAPSFVADYLATLGLLLVPLGALLFVWAMFMRRVEQAKGGAAGGSRIRMFVVGVLVVTAAIIASGQIRDRFGSRQEPITTVPSPGQGAERDDARRRRRAQFQWLPVLVLGSVAFAFVVAGTVVAVRRRRGLLDDNRASLAVALSEVLDDTLDDLRSEPDARKAVIRTYDRMERTLAARGLPRLAFEAPLEYLARVLDAVQVGAHSARRLTRLFERARFSSHEIDTGMKDEAIEALVALRAELEAAR